MVDINIPNAGGGGGRKDNIGQYAKFIPPVIIIILILTSIGSIIYTVDPDEVGVVKRFGKYVRTTKPGLHWKLPWGIETVRNVSVQRYEKEEFGFRTKQAGVKTVYYEPQEYAMRSDYFQLNTYLKKTGLGTQNTFLAESLMLTGDLNAAEVEWIIQYRIKDPVAFSFNVRDMRSTVRSMSEAVMRQVVGDASVNEVITYGKDLVEEQTHTKLQELLDKLETGIKITSVVLQDVNPPSQVKASFNEVNEARQDKERFINQAWQEYNRAIPRAQGEAEKLIREAEGYQMQRVNTAQGDAERFIATWEQYQNAKEVTRKRMYLETLNTVLPRVERKIIMDSEESSILPLLDLNKKGGE